MMVMASGLMASGESRCCAVIRAQVSEFEWVCIRKPGATHLVCLSVQVGAVGIDGALALSST